MKSLILTAVAALSIGSASAQMCQTYGNQTYCSNGTTVQRYGNLSYIQPGQTYGQPYRPQVVCQHYGNMTYCN